MGLHYLKREGQRPLKVDGEQVNVWNLTGGSIPTRKHSFVFPELEVREFRTRGGRCVIWVRGHGIWPPGTKSIMYDSKKKKDIEVDDGGKRAAEHWEAYVYPSEAAWIRHLMGSALFGFATLELRDLIRPSLDNHDLAEDADQAPLHREEQCQKP